MKLSSKLILVLAGCFLNLQAQKKESLDILITINGGQGLQYLSKFDDLSSTLQNLGYPSVSKPLSKTVGGVGVWINRFYFQAGENTFSLKKINAANYSTRLSGSSFELIFGYNVLHSKKLRLFPFAGVGNQNSTIYIDPKNAPAFAGALSNPSTSASTKISVSNVSAGIFGVGLDWKLKSMLNNFVDLNVTFRGAYQYCSTGDWRINEQLTTPPASNFSGVNFSLGLQLALRPRIYLK